MTKKRKFDPKTMTGVMTEAEFIAYIIHEFAESNKTGDKERGEKAMKLLEDAGDKMLELIRQQKSALVN